jgi:hypothetical protein
VEQTVPSSAIRSSDALGVSVIRPHLGAFGPHQLIISIFHSFRDARHSAVYRRTCMTRYTVFQLLTALPN